MTRTGSPAEIIAHSFPAERPQWRVWLIVLLLALLWHLLFFWIRPMLTAPALPPRVELQQIDPRKLEAIRKQWKRKEGEKQLLLDKHQAAANEKEAPPDARYMSDRNIRVEKEQRARQTNVIPKAGSRTESPAKPQSQPRPKTETPREARAPTLGNLGVPLELSSTPPRPPEPRDASSPSEPGGDQALNDRTLPEGSENLLNAQESVFYSFYARLYEAIGPVWQSRIRDVPYRRRVPPGDYTTQVDVVFDQDGSLLEIRRLHGSGITEFDAAVDSSWHKIGRFPNPPKGLLNELGQVHTGWTFTVQVGQGFNVDYLPPERNY